MSFRTVAAVIVDAPADGVRIAREGSVAVTAHYTLNDDGDTDPSVDLNYAKVSPGGSIGFANEPSAVAGTSYTHAFGMPITATPATYTVLVYAINNDVGGNETDAPTFTIVVGPWKEIEAPAATFPGEGSAVGDVG